MKSAARITIRAIRRRTWRLLSFVYPRSLSIHRRRCFSHRSTYLRRNKSDISLQRDTSTRPAKTSARFSEQNLDPCLNGDFAYVILTIGRKFMKAVVRRSSRERDSTVDEQGAIQWCVAYSSDHCVGRLFAREACPKTGETARIPHPRGSHRAAMQLRYASIVFLYRSRRAYNS